MAEVATTQSYVTLINEANKIFQQTTPGAFTYTALGMPASGAAKTEDDLTIWIFKAIYDGGGLEITCKDGVFGKPIQTKPPLGLKFVPLPQGVFDLSQAIQTLNAKGFATFGSVSLGTPVYKDPQPMFWFCVNGQTQGVSACTNAFYPNLFSCAPGKFTLPPEKK